MVSNVGFSPLRGYVHQVNQIGASKGRGGCTQNPRLALLEERCQINGDIGQCRWAELGAWYRAFGQIRAFAREAIQFLALHVREADERVHSIDYEEKEDRLEWRQNG
jgi:hypothetical protein